MLLEVTDEAFFKKAQSVSAREVVVVNDRLEWCVSSLMAMKIKGAYQLRLSPGVGAHDICFSVLNFKGKSLLEGDILYNSVLGPKFGTKARTQFSIES